ncbi:hypothetical protein T4E_11440 [Trichinella pseudospiralis]|uniref:Uncharacterized protein n=1 Tax=Trichinella pseudospiralis TaxID=6337 RepID=A0A0V0XZ25_TRIPS|nr:hypothetical protein T4E_11440 [Trichinella pseudospiralis]
MSVSSREKKQPNNMDGENSIDCDVLLQFLLANCLMNSAETVQKLFDNLKCILKEILVFHFYHK